MAVLTSVVILRPSNVIRLAGGKDFNERIENAIIALK
jgi:hypothetical protein